MHIDRCGNTSGQECHAKDAEKEIKYNSLCIETQRMWSTKCTIILEITGANGIVRNGIKKTVDAIPGNIQQSLRQTAVVGTSHNTESTAVRNLKTERWGSAMVRKENGQREGLYQQTT